MTYPQHRPAARTYRARLILDGYAERLTTRVQPVVVDWTDGDPAAETARRLDALLRVLIEQDGGTRRVHRYHLDICEWPDGHDALWTWVPSWPDDFE